MAWLAVYLLVTAILITVIRQAHISHALRGGEKDFFELIKWGGSTPLLRVGDNLPLWIIYLPAWVVCHWYAALKYCRLNRKYYLRGGKALRQKYAKRALEDIIIGYNERLRCYEIRRERESRPDWRWQDNPWDESSFAVSPATDLAYIAGRKRHWDAADVYAGGPFDEFVADFIMSPFEFWKLAAVSAAQLLFWPVTACVRCVWEYSFVFAAVARPLIIQPLIVLFFGFRNPGGRVGQERIFRYS